MGTLVPMLSSTRREAARRAKAMLAWAWIRTHPREAARLRAEGAWLLGGSVGKVYGDNSAALHQYLRRHHPELPVYWVINRDSPDVEAARAHGPVLFSDEVGTYARAILAAVHVISHGVHDVPVCSSSLSSGALKVRLGHGLTALKKTKARTGHTEASANAVFDLVPVASEFERSHKLEWGIMPEKLVITGLARFDTLLAQQRAHPADPRRLLYMPTWRDGVASASDWEATPFFEGVNGFLTNPALHRLLERRGATLDVFLHMNLDPYVRGLDERLRGTPVRRIAITDPQRLFAEAGLLITDYSSVAWDVLYLDKPVVFYPFDVEDHERDRGGYLDPEVGLPGPVACTPDVLIDTLEAYLSGTLMEDPGYRARVARWQRKAFAFRDDRNAERVTQEILKRLGGDVARVIPQATPVHSPVVEVWR